MDTTVTGIAAVVCRGAAHGRLHGVDDRPVREVDQGADGLRRGSGRCLHLLVGCRVRVEDGESADGPVSALSAGSTTAGWSGCSTPK